MRLQLEAVLPDSECLLLRRGRLPFRWSYDSLSKWAARQDMLGLVFGGSPWTLSLLFNWRFRLQLLLMFGIFEVSATTASMRVTERLWYDYRT